MNTHDDHLDHLINAHLDGRLNEAQRAELFRELLRSPEARRRLDRAAALDQLAAETLRDALEAPRKASRKASVHKPDTAWRRITACAAAAMVLVALGLWSARALTSHGNPAVVEPAPLVEAAEPAPAPIDAVTVELAVETDPPQPEDSRPHPVDPGLQRVEAPVRPRARSDPRLRADDPTRGRQHHRDP